MAEDPQQRTAHRSGPFARRGLSAVAFDSWTASLDGSGAPVERVLAWAPSVTGTLPGRAGAETHGVGGFGGRDGVVIGTRGLLSFGDPARDEARNGGWTGAGWKGAEWSHVGWHQIERGTWNSEARRLSWTPYDGRPTAVTLTDPGRLPELFRERIAASIAVEEVIQISDGRSVVISGRRDLARPDGPIQWRTSLGRGLTWRMPGLRSLAEETLARMRAEYDRL